MTTPAVCHDPVRHVGCGYVITHGCGASAFYVTPFGEVSAHDARYDYAVCSTCGSRFQRIDFFGNPHAALCRNPALAQAEGGV